VVERQLPKLEAHRATADAASTYNASSANPSNNHSSSIPISYEPDPDLVQVMVEWGVLPQAIRTGIVAMVIASSRETSSTSGGQS